MQQFEALKKHVEQEMWAGHCRDCSLHTVSDGQRMCGSFDDILTQHDFISQVHEEKKKKQTIGDDYWGTLFLNDEEDDSDHVMMVFSKMDKNAACTKHIIQIPANLRSTTLVQKNYERITKHVMEATLIVESESDSDSDGIFIVRRKTKRKTSEPWYYHPVLGYFKKSDYSNFGSQ